VTRVKLERWKGRLVERGEREDKGKREEEEEERERGTSSTGVVSMDADRALSR